MKANRNTKKITWILSIAIPIGFLCFGLFMDLHHPPDADEWLTIIPLTLALMFSGIWIIYFFLVLVTAKKNSDGSELSRKRIILRRVVIIAIILSAICGLLL